MSLYYEDVELGKKYGTRGMTVTETEKVFMNLFLHNYSELFTNREYWQAHSPYGKEIMPGSFAFVFSLRLLSHLDLFDDTLVGMVGIDKMRWHRPVTPGDTLWVEVEMLEKRKTSKGDRGVVMHRNSLLNQQNQPVLSYEQTVIVKLRENAATVSDAHTQGRGKDE